MPHKYDLRSGVKKGVKFRSCLVITLRDVAYSWTKIQNQLNVASRSSAQYEHKRNLNNNFEAQKLSGTPTKLTKIKKNNYRCFERSQILTDEH